jgi:hypothetical protein
MNMLVILLSLIFFALGTAKILALRPMRERAAEVGYPRPRIAGSGCARSPGRSVCSSASSSR